MALRHKGMRRWQSVPVATFALACCLLVWHPVRCSAVDQQTVGTEVFADGFEPGGGRQWVANACEASVSTETPAVGKGCLKLTDGGANAQVYLPVKTVPGLKYGLSVAAFRPEANEGPWQGCVAVCRDGGRGNQSTYLARSDLIPQADRWCRLELSFVAPGPRAFIILAGQNATGDITLFDDLRVACLAVPALEPVAEKPNATLELSHVVLAGSPRKIGQTWGRVNRQAIQDDMQEYYLGPAQKQGITPAELMRRSEKFVQLAQKLAPHWLEEARAIARAAEVDADLYLSYVANVYRGLWTGDECTSFAVSPNCTEQGRIFFHKNRDNQPKRQCAFIIESAVPGVNKFIAVSDASVVACMMMVNEKGLAGSADTGGLPVDTPRHRGWMNTALLRYIAEKAGTCEEALRIIQEFVSKGYYAGGGHTGTHWLFVDAAGRVLEISNNSTRVEHRYHREKVYFSAARGEAVRRMRDLPEPIDFAAFHNVSRDPATCFPTSVSGMSVEISRERPDVLTVAWVAMPARSLALPLFMGGSRTPAALLDGSSDELAREAPGDFHTWEPIEAFAFKAQRLVEDEVRELLAHRRPRAARRVLDDWVARCVAAHMSAMSPGY